jgi:hypothetical protein
MANAIMQSAWQSEAGLSTSAEHFAPIEATQLCWQACSGVTLLSPSSDPQPSSDIPTTIRAAHFRQYIIVLVLSLGGRDSITSLGVCLDEVNPIRDEAGSPEKHVCGLQKRIPCDQNLPALRAFGLTGCHG